VLFQARRARPANIYFSLGLTLVFGIGAAAASDGRRAILCALFAGWGFVTILNFERRAFAELLASKDAEIRRLDDRLRANP
jgi:hypothetical protein